MFLIDTNCWLQIIRERSQADGVSQLLRHVPATQLFVSDFSIHSVGVILYRRKFFSDYALFLERASIGSHVQVIDVPVMSLPAVMEATITLKLDFDDAYQYTAAEIHNLRLVSLDADFDRTPRGRLTPEAALAQFQASQQPPAT